MVSTRHHPRPFPEPATPSTYSSSSPTPSNAVSVESISPRKRRSNPSSSTKAASSSPHSYAHKFTPLLLIWLFVSLPLVVWDTGYVMLRPHSMTGGRLHSPIWAPYSLYATVDYIYGFPAWDGRVGFTAAQASLNVVETAMYLYYLKVVLSNASEGLFSFRSLTEFVVGDRDKTVSGPGVARAVIVLFSAAVMTLSKTVLYWLNEYFSDFANVGHNTAFDLVLLWIIPNGLWLVFPAYIIYILGPEMVDEMDNVAGEKHD